MLEIAAARLFVSARRAPRALLEKVQDVGGSGGGVRE